MNLATSHPRRRAVERRVHARLGAGREGDAPPDVADAVAVRGALGQLKRS